jgi:hypothetical protein
MMLSQNFPACRFKEQGYVHSRFWPGREGSEGHVFIQVSLLHNRSRRRSRGCGLARGLRAGRLRGFLADDFAVAENGTALTGIAIRFRYRLRYHVILIVLAIRRFDQTDIKVRAFLAFKQKALINFGYIQFTDYHFILG